MRRAFVRPSRWLFGSLATASIAHALISTAGRFARNSYEEHAHGDAIVLGLAVATVFSAVWLFATARAFAGSVDVVTALARDLRRIDARAASASSALGGALALAGLESLEQIGALGRLGGVADAFGGNLVIGACALAASAVFVVAIVRGFAAWLLDVTAATADVWLSWVATNFVRATRPFDEAALRFVRARDRRRVPSRILVRSIGGFRAPPFRIGID